MSDGVLDAYDDEASAWTDAHTTLDHNGDEDDDGDAWVDEDESAPSPWTAIPRPHDAIRSAKQAASTLAQRLSSQPAPSNDTPSRSARLSGDTQQPKPVPDPVESPPADRWAGRAPPPHLARTTSLGKSARWGPNVTRRVKTIDDVEATELVGGEDYAEQPEGEVKKDDPYHQEETAAVDAFNATADDSAWDAPTGATQGLQPALTPRKVNFQQEVRSQSAQPEVNEEHEEDDETVKATQEERPNDWGEPPYEVPEAPDNGSILRLGDHWLEIEPPMGCRSWEVYFRRNPTLESLDRPEDEDDYYWYDDYYDDYAEYGQEGSSYPVQHPQASPILFVGGLPYSLTVDELREAFTPYGNILRVAIPKDPETGDSRGFGYVEFDSQDSAHSAMEALAGQELGGRTMRLDYALRRGHSNGDGGYTSGNGAYTNGDGGGTGSHQAHEYASEPPAPWQPPPVSKSVTCTNTVALPFNRWGRKATEAGVDEHEPDSQEQPRDAKVNRWLQKQPFESAADDGWGPTEDLQATNDNGWGATGDIQATDDDGWDATNNVVQATNNDGWGPSENVQATNDDGWGPSKEAAAPKDDGSKTTAPVQPPENTHPTSVPMQATFGVDADGEEDAVEIPSTLKIDWPTDTSGGWDDPVGSMPPSKAKTQLEPLQAVHRAQPAEPVQLAQQILTSSPAQEPAVQITSQLKDKDDDKHKDTVTEYDSKKRDHKDDKSDNEINDVHEPTHEDGHDDKNETASQGANDKETDDMNEDRNEPEHEDKMAKSRPANLPQRPQWTPTDSKSSKSTGLNQGIRAPTVPPTGDQILLKNFRSRGGPPAASLPIPRVVKALATRSSEPSTPATPTEPAADPAAELQKLLEKTEAALQGFDAAKKTTGEVPAAIVAADNGSMPPVKKSSEPFDPQEKRTAPPVVEKTAPIEATLAAATPADNRIEALVQQLKAQRERLKAILEG